jgi:hypothetical protein
MLFFNAADPQSRNIETYASNSSKDVQRKYQQKQKEYSAAVSRLQQDLQKVQLITTTTFGVRTDREEDYQVDLGTI